MHAVAINGSPKESGSTKTLLEHVLEPLERSGWTTEILQLGGNELKSCGGCTRCFRSSDGLCALDTDGFNSIYARMLPANAVILGSPAGFNADLVPVVNNFINRSAYLATANKCALAGKVGAAVIDVPRGSFIEAHDKAHRFFLRSKMIVPGVSGWNTDARGLHKHKRISNAATLEEMRNLGEMIDWLARAVEPCLHTLPGETPGRQAVAERRDIFSEPAKPQPTTNAIAKKKFNLPMLLPDSYSELPGR